MVEELAEKIWNFHRLHDDLRKSDVILTLGSHDLRVAEHGARLWLEGWAPWLVFSGGLGRLTRQIWSEPEAVKFAARARELGVPEERILIEDQATHTGENILFSRSLLIQKGITVKTLILVQKPYMERRAYATCRKLWPEVLPVAASPEVSFYDYPNEEISMDDLIHIMVGDFQRILHYPALGYQIPQSPPADVMEAYHELVRLGYTRHLIIEG